MSTDGDRLAAVRAKGSADEVAARNPWYRRRWTLLWWCSVRLVILDAASGLFLLFGDHPVTQTPRVPGRVSLRELVGHGTSVVGWLLVVIGSAEQLATHPLRHSPRRVEPGHAASRAPPARGRVPVSDEEVPIVRHAGIVRLARFRATRVSVPGFGLALGGQLVAAQSPPAALLWTVALAVLGVGVVLVLRDGRRVRVFLAAHPGPG